MIRQRQAAGDITIYKWVQERPVVVVCLLWNSWIVLENYINLTLDNDQLDAQIFNTFITILYMYMFRAISCSSSGGQIVLTF